MLNSFETMRSLESLGRKLRKAPTTPSLARCTMIARGGASRLADLALIGSDFCGCRPR